MRMARMLLVLLLGGATLARADIAGDALVVRSIRYAVDGGAGRLTIATTGIPVVVTGRTKDYITLAFRHATVSSPPGAAHVSFTDGPVRSAVIERSSSDSITIVVRLRSEGRVDVGLEGHNVVVSVTPKVAGNGVSPGQSTPVGGELSTMLRAGEAASDGRQEYRASASANRATVEAPAQIDFISAIGLMAFAALSSLIVAVMVVRRWERNSAVPPLSGQAVVPMSEEAEPPMEPSEDILGMAVLEEEEETEDEIEARAYQLAKALRRGKGEMDLALRMESRQDDILGKKIAKSCRTAKTKAQRVKNAKRLGVGRGEFDLALRLKSMVPVSHKAEEA